MRDVTAAPPSRLPAAPGPRLLAGLVLGLALAVGLGLITTWIFMDSPGRDLRDVAGLMTISALISLAASILVLRAVEERPLGGVTGRVAIVAGFGGMLALVNIGVTAGFMFLNSHDLTLLAALTVFSLAVSGGLAIAVARTIVRPVTELANAVAAIDNAIDEADLDRPPFAPPTNGRGNDEIARLGATIAEMVERLRAAQLQRDRDEAARRELVAAISHDLRTPIAGVRLMAEAIEDGVLDAETERTYLRNINREIQRFDRLIEDLFEHSKIAAGALQLTPADTRVDVLVAEALETVRATADQRRITLHADVPAGLPLLSADPWTLERALRNLLENAVRHTPHGGTVRVIATAGRPAADEHLTLTIHDDGPGIPPDEAERIFEPFYRGDSARRRDGGSAGLGLAIARDIVAAHGGALTVDSAPQRGGCFRLVLPWQGLTPGAP